MTSNGWAPPANLMEYDNEFLIEIEIPEAKEEDIKIQLQNEVLSVIGRQGTDIKEKDNKSHHVERYHNRSTRAFKMPDNIDEKNVSASFKDGILKVLIQKQKKSTTFLAESFL